MPASIRPRWDSRSGGHRDPLSWRSPAPTDVPEGDTIHRAAQTLHRALAGRRVVRFESVFPVLTRVHEDSPLTGQTVEAVAARGKHLLMRFSRGQTLRTHMRMN